MKLNGNSEIEVKIRKHKDFLATTGYGVVIFCLWSIAKALIYVYDILPLFTENNQIAEYSSLFAYGGLLLVSNIIAILIGLKSIGIGKKNKLFTKFFCLIVTVLSVSSFLIVVDDVYTMILMESFELLYLFMAIADFMYFLITLFMCISAFKVRKYGARIGVNEDER